VISVGPDDTLLTAFQRMRAADVSQLPVLDGARLAGVVDESDVLLALRAGSVHYRDSVATAMTRSVHTLAPDAPITEVQRVLDQGLVVVVAGAAGFHGLITRFDLLNHLRRTLT
jgi:cystathionine beta-synthase